MKKQSVTGFFSRLPFFRKDTRGAIAIILALCIPMIVASGGVALDLAQAYNVGSRLGNALDKAALAAGSTNGTDAQVTDRVNKFMNANYPPGKVGSVYDINVTMGQGTVTVSASATVKMTFMSILGYDHIDVVRSSTVKREVAGMELVLVMDTTGSMLDPAGGSLTKIQAAKNAATTLINILYGSESNIPVLWLGIVPFSQDVNIGTAHSAWAVTGSQNWGNTPWTGCIEARETSGRDITDDTPSTQLFPKYYSACNTSYNYWFGNNKTKGSSAATYANCNSGSGVKYTTTTDPTAMSPQFYCSQVMLPMTNDKTAILNSINSMTAAGGTNIDLGMAWGWRMLSPKWRGLWGGLMNTNNLPLAYNTPEMNKVIILMTDGDNSFSANDYTAYGLLSDGRLGTTNTNTANTTLNTKTTAVCNSLKANGVLVYTIALGTDISSTGKTLLQNCATSTSQYFQSPTTDALQSAFQTIANQLNSLHITD